MNILVLGDEIVDDYYFCEATRLCPEACAPVLKINKQVKSPGGAALVHANLVSLGGNNVSAAYGSLSMKTRFFADRTLVARVDRDSIKIEDRKTYWEKIERLAEASDAIAVCDYDKGAMINLPKQLNKFGKPLFVDSKSIRPYNSFCIFPNRFELVKGKSDHEVRKIGNEGCIVDGEHIPTESQQVYDVTGAGDVFMAAFIWAWSQGKDLINSAKVGNRAAGISVRHLGTYIVKPEELVGN